MARARRRRRGGRPVLVQRPSRARGLRSAARAGARGGSPVLTGSAALLAGAIDLHCHVDLELSATAFRKRDPEWAWLPQAEAAGMRGVVLKSHWWPTVHAVHYLAQLYKGPVRVWSSITLNPVVGGPELWAVESAARLGARMVFLPTWGAAQDLRAGGMSARLRGALPSFRPEDIAGSSFLADGGALTAQGRALLDFCAANDLTLGTGHVSWQESLAFAETARRLGYGRLVFSHPLSSSVRAPLDAAQRAASLGAWVELCWTAVAPGRLGAAEAVEWIRQVGTEHVVLSTDRFRPESPSPPELFAELLGMLHDAGLGAQEIRRMAADNPVRALGV